MSFCSPPKLAILHMLPNSNCQTLYDFVNEGIDIGRSSWFSKCLQSTDICIPVFYLFFLFWNKIALMWWEEAVVPPKGQLQNST